MVEQIFTQLIKDNLSALSDKKRFTGLAKDLMPGQVLNVNLLLALYDMGIHSEIEKVPQITNAFAYRFVKQLCDERGVSRVNSDWAVSVWCVCYGKNILRKPCEIKISEPKSGKGPSITEDNVGTKQYSELFRFQKLPDMTGYAIIGFVGENRKTLVLPNLHKNQTVTAIAESAFSESDVQEVVMTEGIASIGAKAFVGCTELRQVIFSDNLVEIGDSAFSGCAALNTAMLPAKLQRIGSYAFASTGIKTVIIPQTVYELGEGAYSNCEKITEITVPDGVVLLKDKLFYGCSSLKKITLHNGIEGIGVKSFSGCDKITTLTIPDSVLHIGEDAFMDTGDKFILICGKGTYAEEYARANKLKFQLS